MEAVAAAPGTGEVNAVPVFGVRIGDAPRAAFLDRLRNDPAVDYLVGPPRVVRVGAEVVGGVLGRECVEEEEGRAFVQSLRHAVQVEAVLVVVGVMVGCLIRLDDRWIQALVGFEVLERACPLGIVARVEDPILDGVGVYQVRLLRVEHFIGRVTIFRQHAIVSVERVVAC